jgi:transposase
MKTYAGIDLHSSTNFTAVIDEHDRRLHGKRLPNRLNAVLSALAPFKDNLAGVVVESTFNWYWLVDGLQEHGYTVHLANPSAIKQYEGSNTPMTGGTHSGWPICCGSTYYLKATSTPSRSAR